MQYRKPKTHTHYSGYACLWQRSVSSSDNPTVSLHHLSAILLRGVKRGVLLAAFRQAPLLRKLYFLKNELRNIFEANLSRQEADTLLNEWLGEAKALSDDSLNKFVCLVESWKSLFWFSLLAGRQTD